MTSYEVVEQGFACGVMITASHNPWTDNGFKIKSPSGAAASADILSRGRAGHPRQRRVAAADAAHRRRARRPAMVHRFDPYPGYVEYLGRSLDLERLKAADMRVLVDPMWGAGRGLDPAAARGRQDPGHRDPLRAQPVVRGRQPGAHRAQHR